MVDPIDLPKFIRNHEPANCKSNKVQYDTIDGRAYRIGKDKRMLGSYAPGIIYSYVSSKGQDLDVGLQYTIKERRIHEETGMASNYGTPFSVQRESRPQFNRDTAGSCIRFILRGFKCQGVEKLDDVQSE